MRASSEKADIERYLSDESRSAGGRAERVVWPASPQEALEALAEAARSGAPVTVSGAGTGVVGGRVPKGGVVLALDAMNAIGDPRPLRGDERAVTGGRAGLEGVERGLVRVEAGATLDALQQHVAAAGWLYPPDPTEWSASMGGTIATNASGARTFRYGPTRAWVRRLVVGLADGTRLELERGAIRARGGRFVIPREGTDELVVPAPDWAAPATTKHAAGYHSEPALDLVDLFIGSEGTLGAVLEAELELVRAPEEIVSGILFFPSLEAALGLVEVARDERGGVRPLCLEYFGEAALELLRGAGVSLPGDARVAIFFEEASSEARRDEVLEAWATLAGEKGASDESWLGEGPSDNRRFREFRHLVPVTINETIARRGVRKVSTDTAVPRGRLLELLSAYERRLEEEGLEHVSFGHIGNDHVHVNVLPRDEAELERAWTLYGELLEIAVGLGGSISGEHGLGKTKARYLRLQYKDEALERMRAIKRAFDPEGRLGAGTLFDEVADAER